MEGAFFASIGNQRQCKRQHCFRSQNIGPVFLYKAISLFITWLKVMSKNVKIAFNFLFFFRIITFKSLLLHLNYGLISSAYPSKLLIIFLLANMKDVKKPR